MKTMRIIATALLPITLLAAAPAVAGDNTWTPSGPAVAVPNASAIHGIHALAISAASGKIYAGTGKNVVYAFGDTSLSQPPTAHDDSFAVNAGGPTDLDVLANDVDPEHAFDAASINIVAAPDDGTATPNADGSIAYTPDAAFGGGDSFTYTVADAAGNVSNVATVHLAVNALPVAGNLNLTVKSGKSVSGVLPGSDPDGESITFAITAPPAHGTAQITDAATGAFTYTPAAGFAGDDAFAFTANDGRADSAPGIVKVTVEGVDAPPSNDGATTGGGNDDGNPPARAANGGGGGALGFLGGLFLLGALLRRART